MTKTKKWSEQCLVKETLKVQESGNEVEKEVMVLHVCTSGKELFRKEFIEGKFKGKNELMIPFDFVVLGDKMFCPRGKFYELTYSLPGSGYVYRALIQCVNAVTDLPLIIGGLRDRNLLPEGFDPDEAFLRDDIDYVNVCHCYRDGDGAAAWCGGFVGEEEHTESVSEYCEKYHHLGCMVVFHRGDRRELSLMPEHTELQEPIFVCGSENVNDPLFEDKRAAELEEMEFHLDMVKETIQKYNLNALLLVDNPEERETKGPHFFLSYDEKFHEQMDQLLEYWRKYINDNKEGNHGTK